MYKELLFHFILGGILFSTIYYFANIVEDPSLSAIIALIPIAIFAGFIIKKVDTCQKYYENSTWNYSRSIVPLYFRFNKNFRNVRKP